VSNQDCLASFSFAELASLEHVLCDSSAAAIDRLHAAEALHDRLAAIATIQHNASFRDENEDFAETVLSDGVALSPYDASMCMRDYLRTARFALGVRRAITKAQDAHPNEKIRVLYAGTGPLAPLAVLQIPHFAAQDVGFTLIDIHTVSTNATKRVLKTLNADDYVDEWVTDDACVWRPEDGKTFHVIVAEVMQRALAKEPQVAVTRNLVKHLAPNGIFVPHEISLSLLAHNPSTSDLGLLGESGEIPKFERVFCGTILSLTATSVESWIVKDGAIDFGVCSVPNFEEDSLKLWIVTEIRIFEDLLLGENESGLTCHEMAGLPKGVTGGDNLQLRYRLGANPGLDISFSS